MFSVEAKIKLIKMADFLDSKGLESQADLIDSLLKESAALPRPISEIGEEESQEKIHSFINWAHSQLDMFQTSLRRKTLSEAIKVDSIFGQPLLHYLDLVDIDSNR